MTVAGAGRNGNVVGSELLAVVGIGLLIGTLTRPDGWYAALVKPSFNPPNWVFGPVWTVLYAMIAIAGARTWENGTGGSDLWLAQMALNFAWTPVFFRLHLLGLALAIIAALLIAILAFIVTRWRADRERAAVRALRGVGGVCRGSQCDHRGAELIGRPGHLSRPLGRMLSFDLPRT